MNVLAFVFGAALFFGGIILFGYSWDGVVFDPWMFGGGILAVSLGIALPIHILNRLDA